MAPARIDPDPARYSARCSVMTPVSLPAKRVTGSSPSQVTVIIVQRVNLTWYDPAVGNWAVAVSANALSSPGFNGPIGNRIVNPDGGGWGVTMEPGDYGVYWDPIARQGFAWANVDTTGDFAMGLAVCPSDCEQTPDGEVNVIDLLVLLNSWGADAGGGPCDVTFDGVVDGMDFTLLLDAWGLCPVESAAAPGPGPREPVAAATHRIGRSPDLDGNGLVDVDDLETLKSAWGLCGDCPSDLDGDGRVDTRDMLSLLRDWGVARGDRHRP